MIDESSAPELFLGMSWTPEELAYCGNAVDRLAARWAAKEAVLKAMGVGFGPYSPLDVEVDSTDQVPRVRLHGLAAQRAADLGITEWALSISHEEGFAVALVVGQ
jgi:holo-[acyl-carrier protein] synthase